MAQNKYQFAFEKVDPGKKNISKPMLAIGYTICFSIGFLFAYLISDAEMANSVNQAYENIHRQNDETDFLSFMNIFPQNTLTKYRNNYEAHNETLWKLWHEDKAGGRSGLFEDGRKIPNDLR